MKGLLLVSFTSPLAAKFLFLFLHTHSATYLKLGNSKSKALKDAEKCIELGKQWAKAHSRLGAALHSLGRLQQALDTFREAIRLDPDNDGNKKSLKGVQEAIEVGIE